MPKQRSSDLNYPNLSYLLSVRYPDCSFLSMTTSKFVPHLWNAHRSNLGKEKHDNAEC